jgi:phosphoribosylformylglycinamidine (FGAM) synthase PurS component
MKYEVSLKEWQYYFFTVDAENEEEAKKKVYEMSEDREVLNNHFHDGDGTIESVYEVEE